MRPFATIPQSIHKPNQTTCWFYWHIVSLHMSGLACYHAADHVSVAVRSVQTHLLRYRSLMSGGKIPSDMMITKKNLDQEKGLGVPLISISVCIFLDNYRYIF